MSLLIIYSGENRFAIDCQYILQVFPKIELKKAGAFYDYLAGYLNLSGDIIPVIDFTYLIERRPSESCLHTRIILLEGLNDKRKICLLGEKAFSFLLKEKSDFKSVEYYLKGFPYLNGIYSDNLGIVQYIDIDELLKKLSLDLFKTQGAGKS